MGLLFYPRGGSAQVTRYLSTALSDAGWPVSLVTGSLGVPGEDTYAPTFFAGSRVHRLDYSPEIGAAAGGSGSARVGVGVGRGAGARAGANDGPVPMHPSYEDRDDAPDPVFAAVPPERAEYLASVWEAPFRAAGADRAHVFHLHHLTPQHDLVARLWPRVPVVAHLHGTETAFVEAVDQRVAAARAVGTSLAGMADRVRTNPDGDRRLDERQQALLQTTRWERWRHGEAWRDRLRHQASAADHVVVVSPAGRGLAAEVLGVDAERITVVPNGVDVTRFRPRPVSPRERRVNFRRWLVEAPQGWDESGVVGSVAYGDDDLDRLLGPEGDALVLITVARFTAAKRLPLLVRAFARAQQRVDRPVSLVVWGGHPGEWEDEHPVTVARSVGARGVFFAGWRGHDDLPGALAASDALVMPSVDDAYPQSALEAMAVGLPVVGTTSGGFPFMVNVDPARPTGWLVPPDDEDALADVLVELAGRPAGIAERGGAALAYAQANFSWAGRVAALEEVYARARDQAAHRTGWARRSTR